MDPIAIDGSLGEGGGQILRSALTLSVWTGKPIRIERIRQARTPPGLRPQHLQAVRAAGRIASAQIEGDAIGATVLGFAPQRVAGGDFRFAIPTAGAATLVLHTVFAPLASAATEENGGSTIRLSGGTHVPFAPCYDYLAQCWGPALTRIGFDIELELERCGFYPRGGGEMVARVGPLTSRHPIDWTERAELSAITPVSFVAGLPPKIAERMTQRAATRLRGSGYGKLLQKPILAERPAASPGCMIGLRCQYGSRTGFFQALGKQGKPAERVADQAVDEFLDFHQSLGFVDPHLADQLLLPLALTAGPARYTTSRVTDHLWTNAQIIRQFVDREIRIDGEVGQPGLVTVTP